MILQHNTPINRLLNLAVMSGANHRLIEALTTGNPAVFDTDVEKPLKSFVVPFTPVQAGSGDPSPTNVRAISGFTGITGYRTGRNIFNKATGYGLTEKNFTVARNSGQGVPIRLKKGVSYTFSTKNGQGVSEISIKEPFGSGMYAVRYGYSYLTYTPTEDIDISFNFYWSAGRPETEDDIMLVVGDEPAEYAPYVGTSFQIAFPNSETIYGGSFDATTGVLTVTHKLWTKNTSTMNRESDNYPGWNQCGIKELVGGNKDGTYRVIMNCGLSVAMITAGAADNVYLAYSRYGMTEAEWKALALDVQIVCELETPQTIQLDPITIQTLIGSNTIWTDTNGTNEITYYKKG